MGSHPVSFSSLCWTCCSSNVCEGWWFLYLTKYWCTGAENLCEVKAHFVSTRWFGVAISKQVLRFNPTCSLNPRAEHTYMTHWNASGKQLRPYTLRHLYLVLTTTSLTARRPSPLLLLCFTWCTASLRLHLFMLHTIACSQFGHKNPSLWPPGMRMIVHEELHNLHFTHSTVTTILVWTTVSYLLHIS
jgi:hypothetical protein